VMPAMIFGVWAACPRRPSLITFDAGAVASPAKLGPC
jgi:hypothetical protein